LISPGSSSRSRVGSGPLPLQSASDLEIAILQGVRLGSTSTKFGGLQVDQARRLKELEQENAKLKRLVAELSLDKLLLKDIASGNF
jgi:hypothetical protein